MSHFDIRSAVRPDPDQPMVDIADYVIDAKIDSQEAYDTARYMLLDSLACAMLAMKFPDCVKHLGPLVPGGEMPGGARVPGTSFELDPVQAAFNIGTLVRWLDFNDTWLAPTIWPARKARRSPSATCSAGRSRRTRSRASTRCRTRSTASAWTT